MKWGVTPNGEYSFNDLSSNLSEISKIQDIEKELAELLKFSKVRNKPKSENKDTRYFSNTLRDRITKRIQKLYQKIIELISQISNQEEISKLNEILRKLETEYPNRFTSDL